MSQKFFNFKKSDDGMTRMQITEIGGEPCRTTVEKNDASATVYFLTISEMESLIRNALDEFGKIPPDKHKIEIA